MKKAISLVLSVMLVISMFAGLNITVYAEEPTVQNSTFPYNNADTYVADSIIRGVIDREGVAHGSSETSLALLHNYTYRTIAEELVDDGALMFDSLFWQNLKSTLSGDFLNITNWQEEMYILLIIDYLNYYSESAEFESNYLKNTFKFTENIYKNVIKYADLEYLDNVDEIIKNQSLSEAVAFSNQWGIVDDLKKYNSVLGDIETVSSTAADYYKNLTKALSVQKADESRIEFLKQMKKAGSDNYYFVTAVDNVISMYESSYGSLAFSQGAKTMLKHGMSVLFSEAKKACPEAAAIIDGLKIYNEGLNWLFNSDDISKNNLKLVIVYTIGSYASSAMRSLRDTFQANPNDDKASAFINGYLGYLKYQEYASNNTIGFVSSALFDGVVNQIINCFSDKNTLTYNEFKEYFHNDISFCESLEKLVQKHYDLYYAIIGYDPSAITDDDPQDNLTEVDPNTATSDDTDFSDILYQLMISGNTIISKDYTLTNDLTIYGDLYFNGGTLDLNGYNFSVGGCIIQSGGVMKINRGTLNIGGDYRIQTLLSNGEYTDSSGYLRMLNDSDLINVHGDFITQSSISTYNANAESNYNRFTAGTINICGNFYQYKGNSGNFDTSGSHTVCFLEDHQHLIHFDSSSGFNKMVTKNPHVVFDNNVGGLTLYNDLTIEGNIDIGRLDLNAQTLIVNGDLHVSGSLEINKGYLVVNGNLKTDGGINCNGKNVDINGDFLQNSSVALNGGTLNITGNLIQARGSFTLGGGTLNVGGDYRIQTLLSNGEYTDSSGYLRMLNDSDLINVHGDFITQSSKSTYNANAESNYNRFTAGMINICGNFYQYNGNGGNFDASGTHKVILNGKDVQIVHFDSSNSHFNHLYLTKNKETGYVFDPNNCWNKLVENVSKTVVNGIKITPSVISSICDETCQFNSYVYGIHSPSQEVVWTISGNTSVNTTISTEGLLTIAEDETAEKLTVTATSTDDPTKSASVTVDIYQIKITSTVSSVTVTMATGETQKLQAVVTGSNNPNQKVIWAVGGNESANTVINENGELTVGEDETAKTIIVRATSVDDPEKYGEFAINITNSDEPQYQIGDTNLDGRITISDVTAIQRHLAELELFTDEQIALADTNGDGIINIIDATHLQKYLAEFDGIVLGKQTE